LDVFEEACKVAGQRVMFDINKGTYVDAGELSDKEKVELFKQEFKILYDQMMLESDSLKKLEERVNVYQGGYVKKASVLRQSTDRVFVELLKAQADLERHHVA